MRTEILDEFGAVRSALVGIAEGIDVQHDAIEFQLSPKTMEHHNLPRVDIGTLEPESFGVELMELAIAAFLRALRAEYRPGRPYALRPLVREAVLDRRANDAGGCLRAQRQTFAVLPVFESVHFSFDDVGDLADGPREQRCRLDQRHLHVAIAVLP